MIELDKLQEDIVLFSKGHYKHKCDGLLALKAVYGFHYGLYAIDIPDQHLLEMVVREYFEIKERIGGHSFNVAQIIIEPHRRKWWDKDKGVSVKDTVREMLNQIGGTIVNCAEGSPIVRLPEKNPAVQAKIDFVSNTEEK